MSLIKYPKFSDWFFGKNIFKDSGYKILFKKDILYILILSFLITILWDIDIKQNEKFIFPLIAILIGAYYTLITQIINIIQFKAIKSLIDNLENGIIEYVFAYQLNLIIIIITLLFWLIISIDYKPSALLNCILYNFQIGSFKYLFKGIIELVGIFLLILSIYSNIKIFNSIGHFLYFQEKIEKT